MVTMQLILSKKRQGKSIFISSYFSRTQAHTTLKIVYTILSCYTLLNFSLNFSLSTLHFSYTPHN
jgi:hypothetical protein